MAGNSTESGRSVASKITAILLAFTEGGVHSLTEIAQLAGLPISTAHRLTFELASRQILERTDDGRYRVGLPLRMICLGEASHTPTIAERAPWMLEDLTGATKQVSRLGVLSGLSVSYIEKRPGHRPVTPFSRAATLPAHPTALGRALLAFLPASTVEMVIAQGLRPYTRYTVTAPDQFRRALTVARLTRVAVTRSELQVDTSTVAMPVFGPGGAVVAAVELTVTDLATELKPAVAALTVATRSLSRELAAGVRSPSADVPTQPAVRLEPVGPVPAFAEAASG